MRGAFFVAEIIIDVENFCKGLSYRAGFYVASDVVHAAEVFDTGGAVVVKIFAARVGGDFLAVVRATEDNFVREIDCR